MLIFKYDNIFWRFMAKSVDVLLLGLLGFIGCLPILTSGRSIYAVMHTFQELESGKQIAIIKTFFRHFTVKKWLVWPTVSVFLTLTNGYAALVILFSEQFQANGVLLMATLMYVYLVAINSYLFPLLTYGTFQPIFWVKFLFYIAIRHLAYTVLLVLINGVLLLLLTYIIPYLFPIFLDAALWVTFKITMYLVQQNDYEQLFNRLAKEQKQ